VWKENPRHASLNYKQVHSRDPIYSVRIGLAYRAIGVLEDDTMIWFWIGSHEAYNSMLSKL
jgi:hypothetical protein